MVQRTTNLLKNNPFLFLRYLSVVIVYFCYFIGPVQADLLAFFKKESKDQWTVKTLQFEGNDIFSAEFLSFIVTAKPKLKTCIADLDNDQQRLKDTGFFEKVSYTYSSRNNKVAITFSVREKQLQPQYVIKSIRAEGNAKTRSRVILREIDLSQGEKFDVEKLRNGLEELEKIRIFKKVDFHIMVLEQNLIDLVIDVEEGMMHVGFVFPTYSSDNPDLWGIGPVGGYININFLGTGSWIGFGGMWAKNRVLLGGMMIPRLFGTQQDLSFGFGYGEREQETFSKTFKKTGGEFKINVTGAVAYWDIPLNNNLKVLQFGGFLQTTFDQIKGKIPSDDAWGPIYSVAIAFDNRDDELEPRSGWYPGLRLDVGYYVDEEGERSNYIRYNPTLKRYFHLGSKHSLALQVRGGVTNKDIPYLGKYQLGGSNDLRGFPEWSLVGNNYFLTNVEYRFPLYSYRANYGVSGVLFVDAGQAWDIGQKDFLDKLHISEGIGLRFLLGPMILRLDYGFSEYTEGIYFYFGHLF